MKSNKDTNKIKKVKKKTSEIKTNITNNGFLKGKVLTNVLKFNSINNVVELLDKINPDEKLKLLLNYNKNKFYVFKSEDTKKKNAESNNNDNILNMKEIGTFFKSFYSDEPFQWDDSFLKKPAKLKYEIAPTNFEIKENYIVSENKFINSISFEYLGTYNSFENILKNNDCWLIIDFYKVNNSYLLNKLNEMDENKVLEKKFSDFILNKLDDIMQKLKYDTIFQCEVKLLLYSSSLENMKEDIEIIKKDLIDNHYTFYIQQERMNTRKIFEKCIYSHRNMNRINSIINRDLYKMIGSDVDV